MKNKVIISNVHEYRVSDVDCEHLCQKAILAGVDRVLLGPASIEGVRKYINKFDLCLYTSVSYPSGAFFPEQKSEEISELVELYPEIKGFFVVAAVGRYLSGYKEEIKDEMKAIKEAAQGRDIFYVIETTLLSKEQMQEICRLASEEGLEGIVSTTGFEYYKIPLPTLEQLSALAASAKDRLQVVEGAGFGEEDLIAQTLEAGADFVLVDCIDQFIFN